MKIVAAVLVALLLTACSSFHFDHQELRLAHDPEADVLEIHILYRNVRPSGEDEGDREDYDEVVGRILKGERFFLLPPLFWDMDWEEQVSDLGRPGKELDEEDRMTLAFARCLSVVEARRFEDDRGRPCLLQKVRLAPASRSMQLINEGIRDGILQDAESGERLEEDDPEFDLRTRRLWVEEARAGVDWVVWKERTLTFTMPVSPSGAARLIEELVHLSRSGSGREALPLVSAITRSLTSLEIRDDHLYLEFAPGEDGWLSFELDDLVWD